MPRDNALETWHRAGETFRHRGHEMFYRDGGEGEALVLLHGFPTASWDWHALWPELSRRFRLVAPDMLGFGFSAKPKRHRYTLFEQADLHEALLERLGMGRAHLLAHDYGDTVAQELLARQLEGTGRFEVLSLCLLNGGLFPETQRPRPVQRLLASPIGFLVARLLTERVFRRAFAKVFAPATRPTEAEMASFWRLVSRDGGTRISHRILRYLDERRRHRDRWVGALVRAPLRRRFVCGLLDPVSGEAMARRYRELVPEPDVVELPDVGHYPQIEAPERVLSACLELVGAAGARGWDG